MIGFFNKKETRSLKFTGTKSLSCFSCGLYKHAKSPKMEPYGNFKKGIMVLGDMMSPLDDDKGMTFQGKAGRLLQKTLSDLGVNLFEDCISLNAINCAPPDGKGPTSKEIDCCRDVKVLKALHDYKPKMVLVLGGTALTSILGPRWTSSSKLGGIGKWRGWTCPDQDYKTWICPTFSPSYIEKLEGKDEIQLIWEQDIENALKVLKRPFPVNTQPNIRIIEDLQELYQIPDVPVAFDYETTGIKPQAKGHKIVCASIAYNENDVLAFMMPERKSQRKPFIDFLQSDRPKIASNMKYEDTWSNVILKTPVNNWYHDTMLESHILDNRTGVTGLKFQAYVNFGVISYEEEEKEFLKSKEKDGSNGFNRILDLVSQPRGREELLKYCAMDSILEYKLAMVQIKQRDELTGRA